MSSSDFETVLIQDDRIANLTDKINYAVNKGAQQITTSEFNRTSESTSSIIFNVPVPSLETVIDRRVMIRSTITLRITGKAANNKQSINMVIVIVWHLSPSTNLLIPCLRQSTITQFR